MIVKVVKQLQELTNYAEKVCWRLAERYGFLRPHYRRPWIRKDIARILKMCGADRSVDEIAKEFGTTARTVHPKIIRNGKRIERDGSIYTVSLIADVLRVTRATVRQWHTDGRLELNSEVRGSISVQFAEMKNSNGSAARTTVI